MGQHPAPTQLEPVSGVSSCQTTPTVLSVHTFSIISLEFQQIFARVFSLKLKVFHPSLFSGSKVLFPPSRPVGISPLANLSLILLCQLQDQIPQLFLILAGLAGEAENHGTEANLESKLRRIQWRLRVKQQKMWRCRCCQRMGRRQLSSSNVSVCTPWYP